MVRHPQLRAHFQNIVFVALVLIPTAGETIRITPLDPCRACSEYELGNLNPAWSPDGNYIAVATANWYPPYYLLWAAVYVVPAVPGVDPLEFFYYGEHVDVMQPAWSPDGSRLVFSMFSGLYTLSRTGERTPLIEGQYRHPAWSPDGSTIACEAQGNVSLVSAVGGTPSQLTTQGGYTPAWSPDGTKIAYSTDGFIWVIPSSGGDPRRLVEGADPAWSPDGGWIAFSSDRTANSDIWVIATTGGTPVQVTNDAVDESDPTWAPDGNSIAYTRIEFDCACIWVASELPDFTIAVEGTSWSKVKGLYR